MWVQPSDCPNCEKTLDANLSQITTGMAWWYRYYAKEQSVEDRRNYESAEGKAKARQIGLWAHKSPINPYNWRKKKIVKGRGFNEDIEIFILRGKRWCARKDSNL